MTEDDRRDRKTTAQILTVIVTSVAIANIAFYFLSNLYFQDHPELAASGHVTDVRLAFLVFSVVVGAGALAAAIQPLWTGHSIAVGAGLMSLAASAGALSKDLPGVLTVALLVLGLLYPLLVWRSLLRERGAWSMLIALCAVYATVLLFGAPKVRGILGIGLWTALIIPGLLVVATFGLALVRDRYRDN